MTVPEAHPVLGPQQWWVHRERAREIAGRLNVAHGDLVDVMRAALEEKTWSGDGIRSPEHWLMLNAGLSRAHALEVVRMAERRTDLPTAADLQRTGQLSLDQADALAKHTPSDHEASAARLAAQMTVPEIQKTFSRYVFDQPKPERWRSAWDRVDADPELQIFTHAGRMHLRFDAPLDAGELVRTAVLEAKDALFQSGAESATQARGLIEMARRSLEAGPNSSDGNGLRRKGRRDHWRIYVHLGTDGAWLGGGPSLPDHLLRKYTCDGILQPVWETDGVPVNVGRSQRIVPDRTRRLISDRDRGCRYPGCPVGSASCLEVHHLEHWLDGGPTDMNRMVSLCPFHHDRHHAGAFSMSGDPSTPQGVRFERVDGHQIRLARPRVTAAPRAPGPRYHGSIGEPIDTDFFTINRNQCADP